MLWRQAERGICRRRSFSGSKRAALEHLRSFSPLPHFRRSVRKPLLSRTTGSKQETLQAWQSSCRWITITTCSVIHIFICVFIFSLHRGWWITWLRLCHPDRRKRWLTFCLLVWKWTLAENVTGQLVRLSFASPVLDLLARHVKGTAPLMRRSHTRLCCRDRKRVVSKSCTEVPPLISHWWISHWRLVQLFK